MPRHRPRRGGLRRGGRDEFVRGRIGIELPGGKEISVTASVGVAVKGTLERPEQLIAAADEALYEAKRNGKNRVVAADPLPEAAAAAPV